MSDDALARGGRDRTLAIIALLEADAEAARDTLAPYLGDARFVYDLLQVIVRDFTWSNEQRREVPRHRWLDAAWLVELMTRTHDELTAERITWNHPNDRAGIARDYKKRLNEILKLVAPAPRSKPKAARKPNRTALLARAHEEVAPLVARLDAAIAKLASLGYTFVAAPRAAIAKTKLAAIEKQLGVLPATVRAWYELAGAVDLRGTHSSWPKTGSVLLAPEPFWLTDPLVVLPPAADDEDEALAIVPDALAKAGFSAGPPYTIACGDAALHDPPLDGDPDARTFLSHLSHALAWGGLPGFATIADAPHDFVAAIR